MLKKIYISISNNYYKNKFERDKKKNRKNLIQSFSSLDEHEYEDSLKKMYKERTGKELDFENPVTYTQKIQWLKLYDNLEEKSFYADKYNVRKFISETIGDKYLIPLISIDGKDHFFNANDIDFTKLPNSFVLKCNHGSGMNIIVKDKSILSKKDIKDIKKKLNGWLNENYAFLCGFELIYNNITPCILIEKYMAVDGDLPDLKFFCFNGKIVNIIYDRNRFTEHSRNFYDKDWNYIPIDTDYPSFGDKIPKPDNLEELIIIAEKLSKSFPEVRVDLYNVNGKIYFGELTFIPWSGFVKFKPDDIDYTWGNLIKIDQSKRDNNFRYRKQ